MLVLMVEAWASLQALAPPFPRMPGLPGGFCTWGMFGFPETQGLAGVRLQEGGGGQREKGTGAQVAAGRGRSPVALGNSSSSPALGSLARPPCQS